MTKWAKGNHFEKLGEIKYTHSSYNSFFSIERKTQEDNTVDAYPPAFFFHDYIPYPRDQDVLYGRYFSAWTPINPVLEHGEKYFFPRGIVM